MPLTAIAERAATHEARGAPRRAAPAARRHHADRRLLQLEPRRAEASRSRRCATATGSARKVADPRRDARARRARRRGCTQECGRAAAAAGLDLLIAVGGDPARARWPTRRRRQACRRPRSLYVPTSAEAADLALQKVRAGRSRAGQGIARHPHRRRRRSAEGGVRLMLYHLLYSAAHAGCRCSTCSATSRSAPPARA